MLGQLRKTGGRVKSGTLSGATEFKKAMGNYIEEVKGEGMGRGGAGRIRGNLYGLSVGRMTGVHSRMGAETQNNHKT